ncbi:NHR1 to TAF family protein [Aphelenchoides avenae]|nr:NHR1 to TAF family protein [Aphelenchus avenae]
MQAEEEAGANDPETPQPPPPVPSLSAEPTVEAAVGKCARFFKTLMHLTQSSYHTLATATAVRQIVRDTIFGSLDAQDFAEHLKQTLRSQPQPHLVPFLRKTLPALRQALSAGTQTIEGIGTAEEYEQERASPVVAPATDQQPPVNSAQPSEGRRTNRCEMKANDEAKAKASECPICLDTYVDPRTLPACGHTVCFGCVRKLVEAPPNRFVVACPECRETSRVPKNGFPKNYRLSDIVAEFQAGIACNSCQRTGPKDDTFRCESCRQNVDREQDVVLCAVCATKHLKAYKDHDVVEFETASKRDVEEAVQEINAEDTTYLNLTIASGLNRVKKFARKAIEAAESCEVAAEAIRDELVGREDLARDDLDATERNAIELKELVLRSQSEVVAAITHCEVSIRAQVDICHRAVVEKRLVVGGSANTTANSLDEPSTSSAAVASTSSATPTDASCQNRTGVKRKLPDRFDSSDDEEERDNFFEGLAPI